MSDERPAGQDAPTGRPSLADVAAWLEPSAQPAPADDADPATEEEAGPAEAGEAGPSGDDAAPASEPEELAGSDPATDPLADQSDDPATAAPALPFAGLTDGGTDRSDEAASRYSPAPPVPAVIWSPEPAPDPADDDGAVEDGDAPNADAPNAGEEGGVAGAPDPGATPAEASPVPAGAAGTDEGTGDGAQADDPGSAALFELDLAKLAERARASARREAAPRPEPDAVAAPDPGLDPFPSRDPFVAPDPFPGPFPPSTPPSAPPSESTSAPLPDRFADPFPDLVTASSAVDDEPGQQVAPASEPLVRGDATQAFDLSRDEEDQDEAVSTEVAAASPEGEVVAPVRAAPRTRRAERPAYPRGQLREPIGILRRVRAMLGILLVTVLLGVAAGTAVGAFIFFLAFAVRSAITSQ